MTRRKFPQDHLWGAATSAYQIESTWNEDGKGKNSWDRYAHKPGNICNADTGDVAADRYHRVPEDVALVKELGINSYRSSISWLAVLPQVIYESGGWSERDTVHRLTDYARLMFDQFADRVNLLATHIEPRMIAFLGINYDSALWGFTELGWGVYPLGLTVVLQDLANRHHLPQVFISENGWPARGIPDQDGYVKDTERIEYLRSHMIADFEAIQAGVNPGGCWFWSFMDNFEWSEGFATHFELSHIDYQALKRIAKASFHCYQEMIPRNGLDF